MATYRVWLWQGIVVVVTGLTITLTSVTAHAATCRHPFPTFTPANNGAPVQMWINGQLVAANVHDPVVLAVNDPTVPSGKILVMLYHHFYGPTKQGGISWAKSSDGGLTWTPVVDRYGIPALVAIPRPGESLETPTVIQHQTGGLDMYVMRYPCFDPGSAFNNWNGIFRGRPDCIDRYTTWDPTGKTGWVEAGRAVLVGDGNREGPALITVHGALEWHGGVREASVVRPGKNVLVMAAESSNPDPTKNYREVIFAISFDEGATWKKLPTNPVYGMEQAFGTLQEGHKGMVDLTQVNLSGFLGLNVMVGAGAAKNNSVTSAFQNVLVPTLSPHVLVNPVGPATPATVTRYGATLAREGDGSVHIDPQGRLLLFSGEPVSPPPGQLPSPSGPTYLHLETASCQ